VIFLISSSQVARITGVSHCFPPKAYTFYTDEFKMDHGLKCNKTNHKTFKGQRREKILEPRLGKESLDLKTEVQSLKGKSDRLDSITLQTLG
jgi:hypothetical protein